MQRFVYLFAVFLGGLAVATEQPPPAAAEGRDLRTYDDGGVYHAPVGVAQPADVQRLRDFVWAHWTQKRRGFVEIIFQDLDSGIAAYLFIEPTNGRWRISWREIYSSALSGSRPRPPVSYPTIVTVERCRRSLVFFDAEDHIVKYL